MSGTFDEKMSEKGLAQGLAHSKCSVNVTCYHTAAWDYSHSNWAVQKGQSVTHMEEKLCPPPATNWEGGPPYGLPLWRSRDWDSTSEPGVEMHPSWPFSDISWASSRDPVVLGTWNICLSGSKPSALYPRLKCAGKLLALPSLRMHFFSLSLHSSSYLFIYLLELKYSFSWNCGDSRWYTFIYFFIKMVHLKKCSDLAN